ncbi:hypothetical protein PMW_225 [Pseudomonas phage phiPMW]|uniref:Uncharacterized protein n=1 Tax=Pseudomonas phage phiPMW TaxID=1815582 RepID=A0A1S5R1Q3_9CAUD|nr:hypothetical protein FDG97_gp125 [Pseudomonas phage phiPMW]ANA49350.1 hypothetical protein PMW_225 [Pseudomonas phage phiPMW]
MSGFIVASPSWITVERYNTHDEAVARKNQLEKLGGAKMTVYQLKEVREEVE